MLPIIGSGQWTRTTPLAYEANELPITQSPQLFGAGCQDRTDFESLENSRITNILNPRMERPEALLF